MRAPQISVPAYRVFEPFHVNDDARLNFEAFLEKPNRRLEQRRPVDATEHFPRLVESSDLARNTDRKTAWNTRAPYRVAPEKLSRYRQITILH